MAQAAQQDDPALILVREISSQTYSHVSELDLGNRGLSTLPVEICQLTQLTKLNLAHNALSTLPAEFAALSHLRTLFCLGCHFTTVPTVISQLTALTMLSFKSNRLQSIREDVFPASLEWLILTGTSDTPTALARCVWCVMYPLFSSPPYDR